jgi:WD40 repeat protein
MSSGRSSKFQAHTGEVSLIAVNNDGSAIATYSDEASEGDNSGWNKDESCKQIVKVWTRTGASLASIIIDNESSINSIAFVSEKFLAMAVGDLVMRKSIAMGAGDGALAGIGIITHTTASDDRADKKQEEFEVSAHDGHEVVAVAASKTSNRILSIGDDGCYAILDGTTGKVLKKSKCDDAFALIRPTACSWKCDVNEAFVAYSTSDTSAFILINSEGENIYVKASFLPGVVQRRIYLSSGPHSPVESLCLGSGDVTSIVPNRGNTTSAIITFASGEQDFL